jgi:predicted HD superfamily hydrolase involved in NAD metabolism
MTVNELRKKIKRNGNLTDDVIRTLASNNCHETTLHSKAVAEEAVKLAERFDTDPKKAQIAGLLHDISAVIPFKNRIEIAEELNLDILDEERTFPMIIHQKLSAFIASESFGIQDDAILSAIRCHTTLKKNPSKLDKIIFVADKIQWDQTGTPPYLKGLHDQLQISLDHGTFFFLDYLWQRRDTLKVVHPWLKDAHLQMKIMIRS